MSSLVYLLVWSPPPHFFTQSVSSFRNTCPYHCNLFCCTNAFKRTINHWWWVSQTCCGAGSSWQSAVTVLSINEWRVDERQSRGSWATWLRPENTASHSSKTSSSASAAATREWNDSVRHCSMKHCTTSSDTRWHSVASEPKTRRFDAVYNTHTFTISPSVWPQST